ncbi:Rossman fold protein, TIGR00730 family [bacterium I07]|nr:Rossman fold protein, TIGR00730 family [bacterium I07]
MNENQKKDHETGDDRNGEESFKEPEFGQTDPERIDQVRRIMASPTYIRSDRDLDFLARDEVRSSRLQLEFMKPDLTMEEMGVESTIVVFGGTRVIEPGEARKKEASAQRALSADPGNMKKRRKWEVSKRVLEKSHYYEVARKFGRLVGLAGDGAEDCRLTIVTGGGPGLMEAANRGAHEAGAKSIGLNITLPFEQYPNPFITPELCFQFRYFAIRKMHFLLRAKALIVFPGGFGTFDELFEILTLIQTHKVKPLPVILVGKVYWDQAFNANFLADEGTIDDDDLELFQFAESAEDIWDRIYEWYEGKGESLFSCK